MLREFKADFHIHTCLSPCGSLDMSPRGIVTEAIYKGLDIIGICDHNSAENVAAVIKAAKKEKLKVLPGIEVTSAEEVHVLALFDSVEDALVLQDKIYRNLHGENDETVFGMQVVVNELDEVLDFNKKLLIGATELSIEYIVDFIHSLKGIAIASHIDRGSFSIISQLGFIPENLKFDGLEISPNITCEEARTKFSMYNNFGLITSSDAHFLQQIGKSTTGLLIETPSVQEIKQALVNEGGRKILN